MNAAIDNGNLHSRLGQDRDSTISNVALQVPSLLQSESGRIVDFNLETSAVNIELLPSLDMAKLKRVRQGTAAF